jgi:hypothetical protein
LAAWQRTVQFTRRAAPLGARGLADLFRDLGASGQVELGQVELRDPELLQIDLAEVELARVGATEVDLTKIDVRQALAERPTSTGGFLPAAVVVAAPFVGHLAAPTADPPQIG